LLLRENEFHVFKNVNRIQNCNKNYAEKNASVRISWTEIRKFPRHGNMENRARAIKMPKRGSCTLKEDTENMYKVSGIATSAVTVFVVAQIFGNT
jgi:hypothetical protein